MNLLFSRMCGNPELVTLIAWSIGQFHLPSWIKSYTYIDLQHRTTGLPN